VANEKTTFADAFSMADQVLYSGVACITDLIVKEGLINLDFADVRVVMREMGKAIMGTGEASGDKRALRAAEAAISNPLIDDISMKGSKGLLISITGGNDLMLYEVDEAATRIREEVDPEANIIVGATFDESLDGIIRVSVVATGADQPSPRPSTGGESRLAELTNKLRSDTQRLAERIQHSDATAPARGAPHGLATPVAPPSPTQAAATAAAIDSAATAAVAAAVLPPDAIEDVLIRPIPPKPSLFAEAIKDEPKVPEPQVPKTYIMPEAERVQTRPRMPRIDELPVPAQNVIRKTRGEIDEAEAQEKRPKGLFKRLATGLGGRRAEADEVAEDDVEIQPATRSDPTSDRSTRPARPADSRPDPISEYAKRSAPQGLDVHGRQTTVDNRHEDELDIPAFLRRQA